jgi:predicted nucleic acid-binding protein
VIVVDASALVDWLLQTPAHGPAVAERIRAGQFVQTLDLAYLEVVSALQRKVTRGDLGVRRARLALVDLADTPLRSNPAAPLIERIWNLRAKLSAHDAAYVALAEALDTPLVTTDAGLARSSGHRARIVKV